MIFNYAVFVMKKAIFFSKDASLEAYGLLPTGAYLRVGNCEVPCQHLR